MNTKARLYLLILGELSAGVILCCSAIYTQPTKPPQQLIEDSWRGEQSYPVNQSIPFSPVLGVMGAAALGKGLWDFWHSFNNEEISPEAIDQLLEIEEEEEEIALQPQEKVFYSQSRPSSVPNPVKPKTDTNRSTLGNQPSDTIYHQSVQPEPKTPPQATKQTVAKHPQAQQKKVADKKKSIILHHLLDRFKYNAMSTIFVGAPRMGKSTAQKAWLASVYEKCPEAIFRIVSRKNDSFLGLVNLPGCVVQVRGDNLCPLFPQIKEIDEILQERIDLPEDERQNLPDCWLVLDDWFATAVALSMTKDKKLKTLWEIAQTRIANIVTLGSEVRVGVCASTHTLNLEHLGLAQDATIRSFLNLCFFCRETVNPKGQVEGGFEMIQNTFQSQYFLSQNDKNKLYPKFLALKAHSKESGLPIILHTMGQPEVGLMPDLSWTKTYQIPINQAQVADHFESLYNQDPELSNFSDLIEIESDIESDADPNEYEEGGNNYELDNSGNFVDYDEEESPMLSNYSEEEE